MATPHDSDTTFDPATSPMSAIARVVLRHPRVAYQADKTCGSLVLVLKDELLVLESAKLHAALTPIADFAGTLGTAAPGLLPPGSDDVEVWRIKDPKLGDSIYWSRKLRTLVKVTLVPGTPPVLLPTVTPNHVCVVAPNYDICPHGPPRLTAPRVDFVPPFGGGKPVGVVVIDTGYIGGHPDLQARGHIESRPGHWLDTSVLPGRWRPSRPDVPDADHDRLLDGVAGHGTFIAGLIASRCKEAEIVVVGHRHECLPADVRPEPEDAARLFTSEIAVALSVLSYIRADVISCGFAFPTLDALGSIAFSLVFAAFGPDRPAVVAPAGNESTECPYWPAAHARAIGVASTDPAGTARADFSNWGRWADCCARGAEVVSTFLHFAGFPQDHVPAPGERPWRYRGWADWSGTSFAAPKVAAEIARVRAEQGYEPVAAYEHLLAGREPRVRVDRITSGRVTLPHLRLG